MVEVKYWETNSQRRKNEEPVGVFNIDITPIAVPEVDERLTGEAREVAVKQRAKKVEKAILECKFKALDKVREIVGYGGVLVANIVESEKK